MMPEPVRFPHAPIVEAVLEIQAKVPSAVSLETLASVQGALKEQYPSKRTRIALKGGVKFEEGKEPEFFTPSHEIIGYIFTSSDGKQAIQSRLNGFAFSRLKPYDRWETFRNDACNLWRHYSEVTSPEVITRLGLRYINRIEIPLPFLDFKEYILTTLEIAPGLPPAMRTFFMRMEIPEPSLDAHIIITQTIEPVTEDKKLPLIFDIDVFREGLFDVRSGDIWTIFEGLRNLKNDIFFKSLTDKAKNLFR
jgi:uncharacterized protein (TIGR04255 family)